MKRGVSEPLTTSICPSVLVEFQSLQLGIPCTDEGLLLLGRGTAGGQDGCERMGWRKRESGPSRAPSQLIDLRCVENRGCNVGKGHKEPRAPVGPLREEGVVDFAHRRVHGQGLVQLRQFRHSRPVGTLSNNEPGGGRQPVECHCGVRVAYAVRPVVAHSHP